MIKIFTKILSLVVVFLLSSPVFANVSDMQKHSASGVETKIIASVANINNQSKIVLGLDFNLPSGWKIYSQNSSDIGIPPELDFAGSDHYQSHQIIWPKAKEGQEDFGSEIVKYSYYDQHIILPVIVDVSSVLDANKIKVSLHYSICNNICIPVQQNFDFSLNNKVQNNILQEIQPFSSVDLLANSAPNLLDSINLNKPVKKKISLAIVIGAIIGGFILNIMPCVLPVLSIKLMSILKHSGAKINKIRFSFFATILGIIFCFSTLAIITFIIKSTGDSLGWGFQFQNPYFLILMIGILVLFTAQLCGFFEIEVNSFLASLLNKKISQQEVKKHIFLPNFLSGILAVLLATPCSAPFLGTAISFAFTQDFFTIFFVFILIGFGFALPYAILIIAPQFIRILPKPGDWMQKTKQIMAGMLGATIIWLLSVLAENIGIIASCIVFIANLLMFYCLKSKASNKIKIAVLAVLFVVSVVVPMTFHNHKKIQEDAYNSLWSTFDESILNNLIKEQKIILVDITAKWCITCHANKILVLQSKEIVDLLKSGQIIGLKADITSPDQDIINFMKKHNRVAIPFNAVYGPNAKQGLLASEFLNKQELLSLIKQAKGQK